MAESNQSHSTAACKSLGGIKRSHGGKFPMRHEPIVGAGQEPAENSAARCAFVNSRNYKYKLLRALFG